MLRPALAAGVAIGLLALTGTGAGASVAATPSISITSPANDASYELGSRLIAHFQCTEGGSSAGISTCTGTVPAGQAIDTSSAGLKSFTVTATDTGGATVTQQVTYRIWTYVNPLRAVAGLQASRIDMGVDYSGSGPILALGRAQIVVASDKLAGPESCWGKTCVPAPGDWIAYRLLDGPFAGKFVYVVENITIKVRTGQIVRAGQKIAILHDASPNLEIGWAAGHSAYTLAAARNHQCACIDPGGWSSIEGRNFNGLLAWLGAPSGFLQNTPSQSMPAGWPALPARRPKK